MSSKSISVRIQPNSGRKGAGQRKHDLRDPSATPDYVDPTRSALNSVIIPPPKSEDVRAEIAANRLAAGQKKLQADARTTIAGVLTFGTDAQIIIERLSRSEQDALFERLAQRVAKEASRPLLGLVVHRDESAIHAHFTLRGYELKDGREIAPRFTPADLKRLQDVVSYEVGHLGIERGTPKAERIERGEGKAQTIHRTVAELHNDLPKERAAEAQKIKEAQEKRSYYESLATKAREQLKAEGADAERLLKRIETYEARISKLDEALKPPATAQMLKGVEPMKRINAEVVNGSKFGFKTFADYKIVTAEEATRFEKQAAEREKTLMAELAKAQKTLGDPVIIRVLDMVEKQKQVEQVEREKAMQELHEMAHGSKRRVKQASQDYGLGD
jgi:uncharacterized protein YbjQ (UPF0145 family)